MKTFKKITVAAIAFAGILVAACSQDKKQGSDTKEQTDNKQKARKWYDAFNAKDTVLLQSLLDEEWQDLPTDPKHPVGKKETGELLTHLTTVFSDFNCEIKDILQDGNKVIVRSVLRGKQASDFMGFPSKARSISIQAIDIHEFRNGKIVRTWHTEDWLSGLGQLGHLPEAKP
ncbi:steroid delta-isomerase-like uncharacterized protein [Pedobacter sp. AK017]|uniref:ester cyclase n=1 Tax=Pedobacter sp. AK017 TaxID=2723073 RepID=UPI0016153459|nr:ester cyclase [Pedobacter sp. AK017]MBB5436776.1 steroid delta-isomerase-like uncharacterized protein [Pedobacter sp. AK017]